MAKPLVLSIFPGLDLLGMGFEAEGYCVVRGPDVLWGGDVRSFHPPSGVFDGVIGGDPCQSHSALANLVRAKGFEPTFSDLTDEFLRVIDEALPTWFLRENVPRAPGIHHDDYEIHSFELDNAWLDAGDGLGHKQQRRRRFWFGTRGGGLVDLRRHLSFAALGAAASAPAVTGAHRCHARPKGSHGEVYTFAEMLHLQGLPADSLVHAPFTMEAKRKLVGNGVPIGMARALARAVRSAAAA